MNNHCIQPFLNKTYLRAVRAQGIYIETENGMRYLDGCSGAMNCSLGHSHEKMLPFLRSHADQLQYVYRAQFGSEESEKLATTLFEISPLKTFAHSFMVTSGSEANETAMKVALQYWQERKEPGKKIFISRDKSYHGITLGALSLSGHAGRRALFEDSLPQYARLESDLENTSLDEQREEFVRIIESHGADRIAAFIAEPVVGAAGTALSPPAGYYEMIRQICDHFKILFIADEILTGIGRTGKWFCLDHWSAQADIMTVGKSLGAGYAPIAATMMTHEILEPIRKGSGLIMSGHTYSGHPLSCAVGNRVIEVIREDDLISRVNTMGAILKSEIEGLPGEFEMIRTVRSKGLLFGLELEYDNPAIQWRVVDRCFENGLIVYPSASGNPGFRNSGIIVAPPYIISEDQIQELIEILKKSLYDVQSEKSGQTFQQMRGF